MKTRWLGLCLAVAAIVGCGGGSASSTASSGTQPATAANTPPQAPQQPPPITLPVTPPNPPPDPAPPQAPPPSTPQDPTPPPSGPFPGASANIPPGPPRTPGTSRLIILVAGGNRPGTVDGGRYDGPLYTKGPATSVDFSCDSICFFDLSPQAQLRLAARDPGSTVMWGGSCAFDPCNLDMQNDQTVYASFVDHQLEPAWMSQLIDSSLVTDEAGNLYNIGCTADYTVPLDSRIASCSLLSIDALGNPRFSVHSFTGPAQTSSESVRMGVAGMIFTTENTVLSARSTSDGSVIWRRDYTGRFPSNISYLPAASDGRAIFVTLNDSVAALNARDGSLLWETTVPCNSQIIVDETGNLYFAFDVTSDDFSVSQTTISSLDNGGRLRWQRVTSSLWGHPIAVAAGVLVTEAAEIMDAATGAPRGTGMLNPYFGNGPEGLGQSAVISADGTVVVQNGAGMDGYDGRTGNRLWSQQEFGLYDAFSLRLTSQGVMVVDRAQVRTIALDGTALLGTWLDTAEGNAMLLSNGLFVSTNSHQAFPPLPGNPTLAAHGWRGVGGGSDGQFRAR